jgi:hypothetical protein
MCDSIDSRVVRFIGEEALSSSLHALIHRTKQEAMGNARAVLRLSRVDAT